MGEIVGFERVLAEPDAAAVIQQLRGAIRLHNVQLLHGEGAEPCLQRLDGLLGDIQQLARLAAQVGDGAKLHAGRGGVHALPIAQAEV